MQPEVKPLSYNHRNFIFILLTVIFLLIDLTVMVAYAKLGRQLTQLLNGPQAQRRCNQVLASFLMLMAVWLLADTVFKLGS